MIAREIARWWLWLLVGCSLPQKCLEQNRSKTWPLMTFCFDHVCLLFICVFSLGPKRIMVSLHGSGSQVKCLIQTSLAPITSSPFAAVSSFTVTHFWPGQMAPTEVAIQYCRCWWVFCLNLDGTLCIFWWPKRCDGSFDNFASCLGVWWGKNVKKRFFKCYLITWCCWN